MQPQAIHSGFWWEPELPNDLYFGELILFDREHASLILYSPTLSLERKHPLGSRVGLWHSSINISMINSLSLGTEPYPGTRHGHFASNYVVEGPVFIGHLAVLPSVKLEGIQVQLSNDKYLFDVGRDNAVPAVTGSPGELPVPLIPKMEVDVSYKGTSFTIKYEVMRDVKRSIGRRESQRFPSFLIKTTQVQDFSNFFDFVLILQRYLVLITGETVEIDRWLSGHSEGDLTFDIVNLHDARPKSWTWSRYPKLYHATNILSVAIETFIVWVHKYESFEVIINLFFTVLEYELDEESKFIILCQGLEAYYYKCYEKSPRMNSKEYKQKKEEVVELIERNFDGEHNEAFVEIVKTALNHGNRLTLQQIIEKLLHKITELSAYQYVAKDYDALNLSKLIADARNTLTHRSDAQKVSRAKQRLEEIGPIVQKLLAVCLLTEVGLTPEQFEMWFGNDETITR